MPPEPLPGLPAVTLERDVPCRMEDGVTLYVDVYRPADGGPHPVLLTSTPYDKAAAQSVDAYAHPSWYARHGYVVVCQDCRGRYRSEGTFYPFRNEADDLSRTIEWARKLPGTDGRLATYGFSYAGLNQFLAAQRQPHGLAAICPAFTAGRPYDEWFYTQGAFSLAFAASWSTYLAMDVAARRADDAALGALAAAFGSLPGLYWVLPLDAFPGFARSDAPFYFDWLAHPTNDEYWRPFEVDFDSIDMPGFHVAGWWDVFLRGSLRAYTTLAALGKAPQKLVIGPWQHMPWKPVGSAPEDVGSNVVDDWQLRFLDHVLKGRETGVFDSPATVFVINDGWRDLDGWPPSSRGRSRLVPPFGRPRPLLGRRRHTVDRAAAGRAAGPLPLHARPSRALRRRPLLLPRDRRPDGPSRPAGRRAVAARPRLHERAARARPRPRRRRDGDSARGLERDGHRLHGPALRRRHGRPVDQRPGGDRPGELPRLLERPAPIVPGEVYEYRIELGPVGIRIPAGYRLRVDVSSSDFPQWDRNLNSGGPFAREGPSAAKTATQVVLHNRAHPSRITLPVVA